MTNDQMHKNRDQFVSSFVSSLCKTFYYFLAIENNYWSELAIFIHMFNTFLFGFGFALLLVYLYIHKFFKNYIILISAEFLEQEEGELLTTITKPFRKRNQKNRFNI